MIYRAHSSSSFPLLHLDFLPSLLKQLAIAVKQEEHFLT